VRQTIAGVLCLYGKQSRMSRCGVRTMTTALNDTPQRLRLTRLAFGYGNPAVFAATMAISPQRWNAYEEGREPLPLPVALQICTTYGVSLDWLYRGRKDGICTETRNQIDRLENGDANAEARPPLEIRENHDPLKAEKVADHNCIDLREPYELAYWSRRFGVSTEQLADAIHKVGTNVEDVAIAVDSMADRKINHSSRMKGGTVAALGLCVLMIAFILLVWHP
jgi:uncharacterized protein DUF3606